MAPPKFAADASHPRSTGVCETVHILALAVWLGALMTGAISAAIVFPAVHELNPHLPAFEGYGDEHWKIGAGIVQTRIFIWADLIQLAMAALTFLTLGLRLIGAGVARAPRRAATAVRTVGVGAGVVLVSCNLMILAPRMNPHLKAYWQAAREGRTEDARAESYKFSEYHPAATRVQGATAVAVLVSLVAGAWSLSKRIGE